MYLALAIFLLCMFLGIWAFVDVVLNQRSLSVSKASAALHRSKAERLGLFGEKSSMSLEKDWGIDFQRFLRILLKGFKVQRSS